MKETATMAKKPGSKKYRPTMEVYSLAGRLLNENTLRQHDTHMLIAYADGWTDARVAAEVRKKIPAAAAYTESHVYNHRKRFFGHLVGSKGARAILADEPPPATDADRPNFRSMRNEIIDLRNRVEALELRSRQGKLI